MTVGADRILYEDEYLLAVNKLSNELVVRGAGEVQKLPLLDFLKKEYPELKCLHRLDFETSGVVMFAKSAEVEKAVLESKFKDWKKLYRTLVMGRINRKIGAIRTPLPARGKGTVPATTTYRILEKYANSSYIEAEIETGRHHQIRRHLAGIKHPLILDQIYGHKQFNSVFTQEFGYKKFFLHAFSLTLPHPITGEQIHIEAPMPKVFEAVVKKLGSL